eukprot:Plantae.Rhodophyta-Rhodochaete_pulchella.ctg12154.p1 GENE.Plantae.Rhodophyta-Rhodochaete_pulchella.ctg12154~~Plantae.Rhodophyta-Rhodochaete_pulchella.ctg12154.p1  ORF type:complete len:175 (+),score=22.38 Plantae.Rhodophyta-Rhodochaete_pulchella.ctg12154:41-565(+)
MEGDSGTEPSKSRAEEQTENRKDNVRRGRDLGATEEYKAAKDETKKIGGARGGALRNTEPRRSRLEEDTYKRKDYARNVRVETGSERGTHGSEGGIKDRRRSKSRGVRNTGKSPAEEETHSRKEYTRTAREQTRSKRGIRGNGGELKAGRRRKRRGTAEYGAKKDPSGRGNKGA